MIKNCISTVKYTTCTMLNAAFLEEEKTHKKIQIDLATTKLKHFFCQT